MDPVLKRRLAGAAVLWLGAMLLLPWILDQNPEEGAGTTFVAAEDPEREMRTIDLAPPPLRETVPSEGSRPAEGAPPELARLAPAERQPDGTAEAVTDTAQPVSAPVEPARPADEVAASNRSAPPRASDIPRAASSSAPSVSRAPAATKGAGWSVQVGSFRDLQNAQSLAARLRQHQHGAQVSTLVLNGRTLYRVRVGHMARREEAEALRARIEQSMGLNGRVVPNP